LYIHQDAAISVAGIEKDQAVDYEISRKGNGAYIMVIEGSVEINGQKLTRRDAMGISETGKVQIKGTDNSEVLIVDVPMQ
jgi:redox-sensitive bicupin YhaK (pirin superfamily)